MPWVKWGCALADFDNDGWPDCFLVNGHVDNNRREIGQPVDYEEIPLLFRNLRGKRFRLSTRDVGPYFDTKHVGRGAAFGDIDNDGDIDIVVNHKDAAPACSATTPSRATTGSASSSRAPRATATPSAPRSQVDRRRSDHLPPAQGGLQHEATNDPRVLVGVGPATEVKKVVIRWPSGIEARSKTSRSTRTTRSSSPVRAALRQRPRRAKRRNRRSERFPAGVK